MRRETLSVDLLLQVVPKLAVESPKTVRIQTSQKIEEVILRRKRRKETVLKFGGTTAAPKSSSSAMACDSAAAVIGPELVGQASGKGLVASECKRLRPVLDIENRAVIGLPETSVALIEV